MSDGPGSRSRAWEPVLIAAGAVALTAVVGSILLLAGGHSPVAAAAALVNGSVGSWRTFVSITLVRAVPLTFTGLAVALAFRAGVWNIGAEGQLYAGAICAVAAGLSLAWMPGLVLVPIVLGASAFGGAVWAAVPTVMRVRFGVGEVITTLLMNYVGIHLAAYMVHGPLQEARGVFPQSEAIPAAARLPLLLPGTRLHLGFAVAVILAIAMAVLMRRSRLGFQIRALGAAPEVARVSGRIRTTRVLAITFLASGAIAGLAGGVQVSGVTYTLLESFSPGWGYTAIAVALLAGLDPIGVIVTGVLFGALQAGAGAMQRDAGIPQVWVGVVEALVILAVLGLDRVRRTRRTERAP